jgi:transposase
VSYKLTGVYKLLRRLGFSSLMSRTKHPGSSDEEQDDCKKNLAASHYCPKTTRIMTIG